MVDGADTASQYKHQTISRSRDGMLVNDHMVDGAMVQGDFQEGDRQPTRVIWFRVPALLYLHFLSYTRPMQTVVVTELL